MKKALIAGAASVALAAMPVVGVFAVADHTDTLKLTIQDTCALTRNASSHDVGANNPTQGGWGSDQTANTYTANVLNSTSYAALATSTFDVKCNNESGYQVTVETSGFTGDSTNAETYPWAYSNGGAIVDTGESMWFLTSTGTATLTSNIVDKATAPLASTGKSFTITYGAFVDSSQPADTYTATAAYTFAKLNS